MRRAVATDVKHCRALPWKPARRRRSHTCGPVAFVAAALVALAAPAAQAHAIPRASLSIVEEHPGEAVVQISSTGAAPRLTLSFDAGCSVVRVENAFRASCPAGLGGHRVDVHGLGVVVGEVVAHVTLVDGSSTTALVTAADPTFRIPIAASSTSTISVTTGFIRAGFAHILAGADHLLFLVLLVAGLRRVRDVLVAETAFTASHCISYSAAATGLIHVDAAAAEACIALSLVLLAVDVPLRGDDVAGGVVGTRDLRGVAALCFAFGLVHGLGFAGGLKDTGLPDDHVAAALLSFAAGVEAGQVLVLAAALAVFAVAVRARCDRALTVVVVYGAGALSCAWLFARVALLLGGS